MVSLGAKTKLTPPELARLWGVSPEKIIAWITCGELAAIDASTKRGGRPRYLIDVSAIEAFERQRAVSPPPKRTRSARPSYPKYV